MKKTLLLIIVSVAASLFIIEISLRLLHYPFIGCGRLNEIEETSFGHFDTLTGWSYSPLETYYRDGVTYSFDKYGFRVAKQSQEIDFSKPRILFIGDSITFGYGLNYEDTFAFKIGRLLGDKFEVVNMGVQGYATDQILLRLRQYIDVVKPAVIVNTFIPDHLNRNINTDRRQLAKCISFPGTKPMFIKKDQQENTDLVQKNFPEPIEKKYVNKVPLLVGDISDRLRENSWKREEYDIELTKILLKEIDREASNHQARTYNIFYDNIYDQSSGSFNNRLVKTLFKDQHLRVVPVFDFAKDPNGDYYVPVSHYHPNGNINTLMAQDFYKEFGQEILDLLKQKQH